MPRFSIIIVSWNALHHLKTFLPSVAATRYSDFEIILADNASSDGSKNWVREHYPDVKIVSFDQNYGYCGGNNHAVPYANGNILLFLNNDVKVDPDWLLPLAQLFNTRPDVAAAQPKVRSYKKPGMFEYAGAAGGFIDRYGFPFCRGRIFDTIEKDEGQYDTATTIFWASGAAFAIRKDAFIEQDGFDEDFQFHMEEIDLCWRLWNRGRKVAVCPASVVYHLGGGSLPMDSPRKLYYNYRNSLLMLYKNYATVSMIGKLPVRMILDLIAAFRALISGEFASFKAIIKAHFHFWTMARSSFHKRAQLQKNRTHTDDPPLMQSYSIVWKYFIRRKKRFNEIVQEYL